MRFYSILASSALIAFTSAAPIDLPAVPGLPALPIPDLPDLPLPELPALPVDLPIKEKRAHIDIPAVPGLPALPLPELPDLPLPELPALPVDLPIKEKRAPIDGLPDLTIPLGEPLGELDLSQITKPIDQLVGSKGAPLPGN